MVDITDPRLVFVKMSDAAIPPVGLIEHISDSWWVVRPSDMSLVYWDVTQKRRGSYSPQCNRNEDITDSIIERLYPWAIKMYVPSAFRRINPHDYC